LEVYYADTRSTVGQQPRYAYTQVIRNRSWLVDNTLVDIRLVDGQLIVKPIIQPEFTLEQLLTEVTEDNLHDEINTGPAMGNEAW